ncbi:M48 family metalloprotease [Pseudomonas mangiferae]|uniref:M48 family metalloprotease n=1 Tax=Pseudomonas mangiferae TaxID=2593654 RepID=A0A553GYW6_9PSED|nr:M48 family metalloprotease [Pseudomonas mangiferae]TRX74699.1 M48 family metalloprotease [Pseudomonas mangiferae]
MKPVLLLLILMSAALGGCATNPVTGRSDFVMMSEQQELDMGRRYSQQVAKESPPYADDALQAYVQQVGERVARSSHRSTLAYHFTVVDSADINAFALPGGYIYINRGLLAYLTSEAELAAVLGHEVGHVTARHSVRQQSQGMAWGILGQAVAIGSGVQVAGDLTNLLGNAVVRGYGRDMELEADGLGAQYLARAGYDPQAMIAVVRILKNQEDFARDQAQRQGKPAPTGYHGLFDTHPDNDTRLHQVTGPAQALVGGQQVTNREVFLQHLEDLPVGDSAATGVRRGQRFYHADLDFTVTFPERWVLANQADRLIGQAPDEQAALAVVLGDDIRGLAPLDYLHQQMNGNRLLAEETFEQNGLHGAMAIIPGRPARRLAVIAKGDHSYLFAGLVRAGSLEAYDDAFRSVIASFRGLKPEEKALAQPRRLHLVKLKPGQRLVDLLPADARSEDDEARLRLLNDLYPSGEARPGDWLKVLR